MSAAHHDEAARTEAQRASDELARAQTACPGYSTQDACYRYWTSFRNPTKKHFDLANKHRVLAEKHRAASTALRDAEARACTGVPDAERDISPFFHVEDISSVEKVPVTGADGDVLTGLRVIFKPLAGLSADSLQRTVDCHLARNAVVGADDEHLAYCPLMVHAVTAVVRPVATGFAVEVRPKDDAGSRELAIRGDALAQSVVGAAR